MPILPIDAGRYITPEMERIFNEDAYLQRLLDVEAALASAWAELGLFPKKYVEEIKAKSSTKYVTVERVKEIEKVTKHDIMAVVQALAELCGEAGAFIHYGATSNDIIDTATGMQLRDALMIIYERLQKLEDILLGLTEKYKKTIMVGRTHGQHALPITLGLKFSVWLREISRYIDRIRECKRRAAVGKLTGAVGTQAGFGEVGLKLQGFVMDMLGLQPIDVSTQIVQRDRHAEVVCILAMLASTLDKFALEIRLLQRTEVGELSESFDVERQVGSSTMPHKINPVVSERICGLAKVVRGLVVPALENISSWHERDLTNSSAERIELPSTFILVDYMLVLMANILSNLKVDEKRMFDNLNLTQGRIMSEAIMLALTKKGVDRQEAHKIIRAISIKSVTQNQSFRETLLKDSMILKIVSKTEIENALNPFSYIGTTYQQIDAVIAKTKKEREIR